MPTGYTADIGKDISFEQFVWGCARGFGALIEMRDAPAGAPIPEVFQPSDYNAKALRELRGKVQELEGLSPEQADERATAAHNAAMDKHRRYIREKLDLRRKYMAMLQQAKDWEPPTKDHVGLKAFMIQQIKDSVEFDCEIHSSAPRNYGGEVWLSLELAELKRQISYHEEENAKEIERVESRNQWVEALRSSFSAWGSP